MRASVVAVPGLQSTNSVAVALGLSSSAARGFFPDQGLNLCLLYWQVDSLPLNHQRSPGRQILNRWTTREVLPGPLFVRRGRVSGPKAEAAGSGEMSPAHTPVHTHVHLCAHTYTGSPVHALQTLLENGIAFHSLPVAALTNDHRLGAQSSPDVFSHTLGTRSLQARFGRLASSWRLWGNVCPGFWGASSPRSLSFLSLFTCVSKFPLLTGTPALG